MKFKAEKKFFLTNSNKKFRLDALHIMIYDNVFYRNTVRVEKRSVDPYCTYHAAPHITYLEMASSMLTYWNTHYVVSE